MALLLKHINEPMPPLRTYREGVPPSVEQVIARATEKDPDRRFSSAGEMAKAFSEALRSPDASVRAAAPAPETRRPVEAAPVSVPQPVQPTQPQYQTGPATATMRSFGSSDAMRLS
jgi:serine/threonine-protein kinase